MYRLSKGTNVPGLQLKVLFLPLERHPRKEVIEACAKPFGSYE